MAEEFSAEDISNAWILINSNQQAIEGFQSSLNVKRGLLTQARQEEVTRIAEIRAARIAGTPLPNEADLWVEVAQLRAEEAQLRESINTLRTQIRAAQRENVDLVNALKALALEDVPLPAIPEVPPGSIAFPQVFVSGSLSVGGETSLSDALTLPGGGVVYGGAADPSATSRVNLDGNLHVTNLSAMGNVVAFSTATASDARLKSEVRDLGEELDARAVLRAMRPVAYTDRAGARRVGFIAQELRQLVPQVVNEDPQTGYLSVAYGDLVAVLAAALQQMAGADP